MAHLRQSPTKKTTKSAPSGRRPLEPQPDRRPQAFSYHASRSAREANTGRDLSREDLPVVHRFGPRQWSVVVAMVAIGLLLLLQSTTPIIVVTGSKSSQAILQPSQVYQAAAAKLLSSPLNYLKPVVDTAQLSTKLRSSFPELAQVSVQEPLLGSHPVVTIAAYEPVMLISGNGGTFVVDETGVARLASSQISASLRSTLPLVTDQSGLPLAVDQAALPSEDVNAIRDILAYLKAAQVGWQQLTLPAAANELDAQIAGTSYYVKFALQGGAPVRQQVGTFLAVKASLTGGNAPKAYIDVRVSERAYYK